MVERDPTGLGTQSRAKLHGRLAHRLRSRPVDDKDISFFNRASCKGTSIKGYKAIRSDTRKPGAGKLRDCPRIVDQADEPLPLPLDHPGEHRQGGVQSQGIAFHRCQVPFKLVNVQDGGLLPGIVRGKEVVRHEHAAINGRHSGQISILYLVEPDGCAQALSLSAKVLPEGCKKSEVRRARGRRPVAVHLQLFPCGAPCSPDPGDSCKE